MPYGDCLTGTAENEGETYPTGRQTAVRHTTHLLFRYEIHARNFASHASNHDQHQPLLDQTTICAEHTETFYASKDEQHKEEVSLRTQAYRP